MSFLSKIYNFFQDPNTPNSGFYMALIPMISSVGDYFLGSGNPILMGIGAGIAAIYAGAHAIGQGMASKTPTVVALPGVPMQSTVNQTPFGEPKVGPDAVPLSHADIEAFKQIIARAPNVPMATEVHQGPPPAAQPEPVDANHRPITAADLATGMPPLPGDPTAKPVEPHPSAFWANVNAGAHASQATDALPHDSLANLTQGRSLGMK